MPRAIPMNDFRTKVEQNLNDIVRFSGVISFDS